MLVANTLEKDSCKEAINYFLQYIQNELKILLNYSSSSKEVNLSIIAEKSNYYLQLLITISRAIDFTSRLNDQNGNLDQYLLNYANNLNPSFINHPFISPFISSQFIQLLQEILLLFSSSVMISESLCHLIKTILLNCSTYFAPLLAISLEWIIYIFQV